MTDRNDITRKRQEIVAKLTQARLEKGLSQAQLAELVGTQRSNICRIENGGQNLTLDLLIKISNALDKDVSVLLEEKRPQTTNTYYLKLYDDVLVTFSLQEKGLEGLVAEILSYDESKSHLLPVNMELTSKGIVKWLSHRVIPKNRAFVDEILKTFGLEDLLSAIIIADESTDSQLKKRIIMTGKLSSEEIERFLRLYRCTISDLKQLLRKSNDYLRLIGD